MLKPPVLGSKLAWLKVIRSRAVVAGIGVNWKAGAKCRRLGARAYGSQCHRTIEWQQACFGYVAPAPHLSGALTEAFQWAPDDATEALASQKPGPEEI